MIAPMRFLASCWIRVRPIGFVMGWLCILWFSMLPLEAQPKKMTDSLAIRSVIEQQIQAFQQDDASKAFSFASPEIQKQFGNAQNFMSMVKDAYPAVYRPRSVMFDKLSMVKGNQVQSVLLLAPNGTLMKAMYIMQKQASGSWRISGCYLVTADGTTL
jgi:ketosteroid isomerase-like protein